MNTEDLENLKQTIAKKPREFGEGARRMMHLIGDDLLDDAKQLGDDGDPKTSVLREYLLDRGRELHTDAEKLIP